jgi:purine nucleosidase
MANLAYQARESNYSNLAYQSYEIAANESFYDMWDVLTTCFIPHPDFFDSPVKMKLSIETENYWQGTLYRDPNGREVDVILNILDPDGFYEYVLQQFNR